MVSQLSLALALCACTLKPASCQLDILRLGSELSSELRRIRNIPCGYAADPAASVHTALVKAIASQDQAIKNITDAFALWHSDHIDGVNRPLVMVFTGSSGVGKTESAMAIAEGLMTGRVMTRGADKKEVPEGLLHIVGLQSFTASGAVADEEGGARDEETISVSRMQKILLDRVKDLLHTCNGHGIIVIDELQKMPKAVLAPLRSLLAGEHSVLTHPTEGTFSAARLVIIIITDLDAKDVYDLMTSVYSATAAKRRLDFLHAQLASRMREKINAEFSAGGLDLGYLANAIVTYQPFNQSGIRALLNKELGRLPMASAVRRIAHGVSWTPAFVDMFTTPRYLDYVLKVPQRENDTDTKLSVPSVCALEMLAQVAERRTAFTAPNTLHSKGDVLLAADGSVLAGEGSGQRGSSPGSLVDSDSAYNVCGESCAVPRVCYVATGARGLKQEAAQAWAKFRMRLDVEARTLEPVGHALATVLHEPHSLPDEAMGYRTPSPTLIPTVQRTRTWDAASGAVAGLLGSVSWAAGSFLAQLPLMGSESEDPAVLAAKGRARAAAHATNEHLHRDGERVSSQALPAGRLHFDVSCAKFVPDGACSLRGAEFTMSRCLGRAVPVHPAAHAGRPPSGSERDSHRKHKQEEQEEEEEEEAVWQETCSTFWQGGAF